MLALALKYWQYIAVFFVVAILWAAYQSLINVAYKRGYDTALAEVAQATAEADEAARKKQAQIKTKTKKVTYETRKKDGANAPASPYLRGVLDELRSDD